MKDTDKVTLTFGQLKKLVKESFDTPFRTKDFNVGDEVEFKYYGNWKRGVIEKVNPQWGISIEFPDNPEMNVIRIPARFLKSIDIRGNLRKV